MSIVLISGANKGLYPSSLLKKIGSTKFHGVRPAKPASSLGIGNGFIRKYLARPHTTVIGTVHDLSALTSKTLYDLPKAEGSRIIVVKIESTSESDALEAIKSISTHHISHIDIVIANAGIFSLSAFQKVSEMKTTDLLHHCDVNVAGTVRLFQAVLPLLEKAAVPKFMAVSSVVATIAGMEAAPFTVSFSSYGASKAALNFLVRRIHFENEGLVAFAVHPG